MSSIFNLFDTANNGLATQRDAMQIATDNVANALTPGYKAKKPIFAAKGSEQSFSELLAVMQTDREPGEMAAVLMGDRVGMGSQVAQIQVDQTEGAKLYMPNHPMADEDGMVEMSNVDSAGEMIGMMQSVRQYKANLSIVEMAKKAANEALQMNKNA